MENNEINNITQNSIYKMQSQKDDKKNIEEQTQNESLLKRIKELECEIKLKNKEFENELKLKDKELKLKDKELNKKDNLITELEQKFSELNFGLNHTNPNYF